MTGPVADARVQFSATGVDAIVAGTKEILGGMAAAKTEAARLNSTAAEAGGTLGRMAEGLKGVLGALGAERLTAFVSGSVEAVENLGLLAQKTGISVEALSALKLGAEQANVDVEGLTQGLKFLSKSQSELASGNRDVTDAFHAIGLSARDLQGLPLEQTLQKVANGFGALQDGPNKAAIALRLFGREGTQIIPLLNELAGGGIGKLEQRAAELGILFTSEDAKAARDFADDVKVLKSEAEGLAFSLARNLIPQLANTAHGLQNALSEKHPFTRDLAIGAGSAAVGITAGTGVAGILGLLGVGSLAGPIGTAVAAVIGLTLAIAGLSHASEQARSPVEGFLSTLGGDKKEQVRQLTAQIALQTAEVQRLERAAAEAAAAVPAGPRPGSAAANPNFRSRQDLAAADARRVAQQRAADAAARLAAARGGLAQLTTARDALALPEAPGLPDHALIDAQLAARRAAIQDTQSIIQAGIQNEQQANETAFAKGERSLADYFARRKALIDAGTALEIATLERTRAALAASVPATPAAAVAKRSELDKLDAEIAAKRLEGQGKDDANAEAARQRQLQQRQAELSLTEQIKAAQGDQLGAELTGVDATIEALAQKNVGTQQERDLLRELLTARARLNDLERQSQLAFSALSSDEAAIQRQVATGKLTQAQAEEAIARVERERLPVLRQLASAAEAEAAASGDPQKVAAARALTDQVKDLEANTDLAGKRVAALKDGFESALQSGIGNFISDLTSGTKSLGDAFRDLFQSILDGINQVVAQIIAHQIILALFGGAGATGFASTAGDAGATFGVDSIGAGGGVFAARGGYITGPGGPTADRVNAHLSDGEEVVNAAATAQNRQWLDAINDGLVLPRFDTASPRLALPNPDGATAAQLGMQLGGGFSVDLAEGLVARHTKAFFRTAEGKQLFVQLDAQTRRAPVRAAPGGRA